MRSMHTDKPLHRAADLILEIEQTMRAEGLWHQETPSPAAMASRTPFCADTMEFTQWLRFVFLARMRMLIESGGELPAQSGIAVMARLRLPSDGSVDRLIDQIEAFDRFIESQG
jgi:uncharacterized protein YqcC (DUF446 family)